MITIKINNKEIQFNSYSAFKMGFLSQQLGTAKKDNPFQFKPEDHELGIDWDKGWDVAKKDKAGNVCLIDRIMCGKVEK